MSEDSPEQLAPEATPLLKSRIPYKLIENSNDLAIATAVISESTKPIAVDAERASGFRYGQKAYLVQICVEATAIYLVDPVAQYSYESWQEFVKVVSAKPWIIHAASQDIPCLNEIGIRPTKVLDTELGSRILGLPRVSLGTITEHYLGLKLAKEHSAVDWSERPLKVDWLEYAALDVDVLHELWEFVETDLVSNSKLEIALQEFDNLVNFAPKPTKIDRWRSLTGLHEIKDARSLTIAKSMWDARENLAIEKDIAPGRLIPDLAIVAAVKAMPKTRSELSSLRSFTGRASRTFIDTWWDAFMSGNTTKDLVELRPKATGIPNHRNWPLKFPEANARLLACKEVMAQLSEALKIPAENILSPDTIRALCFEPPENISPDNVAEALLAKRARPWQVEAVLLPMTEALQAEPTSSKEATEPVAD